MNEFEKFYAKIWKINESLVITIPNNLIKGIKWKEGDILKMMGRKQI